ncbi:MAG: hydroxymethylglutaryl-CoA synthase [Nitrososphaerales archaeon]
MKSTKPVGISGYGAYVPQYRLPSTEVARMWRGGGAGPNKEKSVAGLDEDSTTMAVEESRTALEMSGAKELGAVFVGTESKVYAVKPTSTIVAQALGQNYCLAADYEFACKAGTEAMQTVSGLAGSGMIKHGLAIGVDTAQGRPSDELEFTTGCGAASFVISSEQRSCLATIEGSVSYVTDTGDFWRRSKEEYPVHLSRFTGEPAYFHHTQTSVRRLLKELKMKPEDFTYAVFHQPNPRFPLEVAMRLGFTPRQIQTGLLNPVIGNTYSASSMMGLTAVLDEADSEDRILLASFGSGAGSDAFSMQVTKQIQEKRSKGKSIRAMIEKSSKVDYATYAKFRRKIAK